MLAVALLQWWYSRGWLETGKRGLGMASSVVQSFSVPILAKTLFAPWKQIVALKPANDNIQLKLRRVLDNLVSRVVGFMVRSLTLLTALIMALFALAIGVVMIVIWPLIPVSVVILTGKGLGL